MEPAPPAAPSGLKAPRLSTTLLVVMSAIAVIVLASIFGYILFVAPDLRLDERLWWTGLASMIFALAFYLLYAGTRDRTFAKPLAAGFFVIGAGSFYGSIFTNGDSSLLKLIWMILLSIFVIGVLAAMYILARDAERDAVRRSQRKVIP